MTYVEAAQALIRDTAWGEISGIRERAPLIAAAVDRDAAAGQAIYPSPENVFSALRLTPLQNVKAVILGQDPYPTPGNAHGLAFSVPPGQPIPASLKNMFRSLQEDFGFPPPSSGTLTRWAEHGVLLLNTILTVRAGAPLSHKSLGWQTFSEAAVAAVSARQKHVAFLLWGGPAQKYARLVDPARHGLILCPHPSPLNQRKGGAHGFVNAHPFRQANEYLTSKGERPIDWRL
jgi:uracil-DNA glycosylase